jgi:hypothetical protein
MKAALLALLALLMVSGCRDQPEAREQRPGAITETSEQEPSRYAAILAPLIDPAKLDSLKGKRAATPRLRKACYWLEMASRDDHDLEAVISQAHALTGSHRAERMKAQSLSLIRNVTILERLGCFDESGMAKLRNGKAPVITKGPYAGEIVTGDHIIPRSVCEELDERLYNLEFVPLTINQRKGAKVTARQVALAKQWNKEGLLSDEGLRAAIRITLSTPYCSLLIE